METKKFALFGADIEYSLSPAIHQAIYAHMGVTAQYGLISVKPDAFGPALSELFDLDGFNVTKPFKKRMIDFVDSVEGDWDSVNLVVKRDGKRVGHNTDYYGFKRHFSQVADALDKRVLVLGAGGVAEIVVPYFVGEGADVFVYNRTPARAAGLCEHYGATRIADKSGRYDIVVNCTSCGLNPGEDISDGIDFSETAVAYDLVYFETEFLKKARAAGVATVVNGLVMLIHQAIRADEIFFDTKIEGKEELCRKIMETLAQDNKQD